MNIFREGEKVRYRGQVYFIEKFRKNGAELRDVKRLTLNEFRFNSTLKEEDKGTIVPTKDLQKIYSINDLFFILCDNDGSRPFIDDNELKKEINNQFQKYGQKYKYEIINCKSSGFKNPELNVEVV